jgi:hypothetical protein
MKKLIFLMVFVGVELSAQIQFDPINKPNKYNEYNYFLKLNNGTIYLGNLFKLENGKWFDKRNKILPNLSGRFVAYSDTLVQISNSFINDSMYLKFYYDDFNVSFKYYKHRINDSIVFYNLFGTNSKLLYNTYSSGFFTNFYAKINLFKSINLSEIKYQSNRMVFGSSIIGFGSFMALGQIEPFLIKSIDYGDNWEYDSLYYNGISNIRQFGLRGLDDNYLYFVISNSSFQRFNYRRGINNQNWEQFDNGFSIIPSDFRSFRTIKKINNKLYALTLAGIMFSNDGLNWLPEGKFYYESTNDIIDYGDSLLVATRNGVKIKRPGIMEWQDFNDGLPANKSTQLLQVCNTNIINNDNYSFDSGITWHRFKDKLPAKLFNLGSFGLDSTNIYAGFDDTLFVFKPNGLVDKIKTTGLLSNTFTISEKIIKHKGEFFCYWGGNRIYKSTNDGFTWSVCNTGTATTGASYYSIYQDKNNIYFSSGRNLYQSSNSGVSWQLLKTATAANSINYFVVENNIMVTKRGEDNFYVYSKINGIWWDTSKVCNTNSFSVYEGCVPQVIMRGIPMRINRDNKLYYSLDTLKTWREVSFNLNLPENVFRSTLLTNFHVLNQDTTLYLACDSGLFRAEIDIRMLDTAGVVASVKLNEKQNESREQLKLYPNPTTGSLQVSVSEAEIVEVRVYNIVGSLQYSVGNNQSAVDNRQLAINNQQSQVSSLKSNISTLDISSLPQGMYIIQVKTNKGEVLRGKVMKN